MQYQPAILGTARLGNFRLGYQTAAMMAVRPTKSRITLAGTPIHVRVGSVTIKDVANDAPNTCSLIVDAATPPVSAQRLRITINSDAPRLLFDGALETVEETYEGLPSHVVYPCTAQDDTPRANRRIPLGYWETISATTVAQELIAAFAPGFTTDNVEAGLPAVTVHFEGSEAGMNGCLRQIAKLSGGYFYWEARDLHLFTSEATDLPDDLDSTPGRFLDKTHITITWDDSRLRTRVYGKGHQESTLSDIPIGGTVIPLGDVSMYNPLGGQVISESQILDYTGTVVGGLGALVGTTVTPTNQPTVALVTAASGIDAGDHYWAYTFYDGTGETLPSPLSATLALGSVVTAPSSAPTPTRLAGGALSVGVYKWKTAFVDSVGGITTVSPESSSLTMANTPTAPAAIGTSGTTGAQGSDGLLDVSANYGYAFTFVEDSTGLESTLSPTVAFTSAGPGDKGFLVTSGTSAPPASHSRRFYRTEGGGSVYKRLPGPANGFEAVDGTGTYWWEGYADGSLGAVPPAVANFRQASVITPVSADPNVATVNVYRTEANGSTFKLAGSVANGVTTFADNVADGSLGATAPTSSTAVYRQAALSGIAVLTGATGRKVYRTAAAGSQLKLAYTIANNTATTQTDSLADSGLGANAPTSDTSAFVAQTGSVQAGSTSMLVTSTGPFQSAGGWAFIGALPIRYTGFSGSSITGIPSTGAGALTTTVRYGSEVLAASMLAGVSGVARALIKGAPIHIWVQRDDMAAQAELAAREGEGDGIIEHRISDERRGEASLIALCDADLAQFSRPVVTVKYATRDVKTKSGKPIVIDLPSPLIDETLTIQDVTIDQIDIASGLAPRFTVTASNVGVVTVEALLRQMASGLGGL